MEKATVPLLRAYASARGLTAAIRYHGAQPPDALCQQRYFLNTSSTL